MTSYKWWDTKRSDYPHMSFPGTNYVMPGSVGKADGGFTFKELLDENFDRFSGGVCVSRDLCSIPGPPTNSPPRYMGGKLNYGEQDWQEDYSNIPWGFVTKYVRSGEMAAGKSADPGGEWLKGQRAIWGTMTRTVATTLPDLNKYKDDTWEWTIHR